MGLGVKTSGPFFVAVRGYIVHPSVYRSEWKRMDTEKLWVAAIEQIGGLTYRAVGYYL